MAGNLGNWRIPKTEVGQEKTLANLVKKFQYLSEPGNVNKFMKFITKRLDKILVNRLKNLNSHPKDTGLLQISWSVPHNYLDNHTGSDWRVFAENTATVDEWKIAKSAGGGRGGYGAYIKRRKRGNPQFAKKRRYLKYVEARTGFYSHQLRVLKQSIPLLYSNLVNSYLKLAWSKNKITQEELNAYWR